MNAKRRRIQNSEFRIRKREEKKYRKDEHRTFNIERRIKEILNKEKEKRVG